MPRATAVEVVPNVFGPVVKVRVFIEIDGIRRALELPEQHVQNGDGLRIELPDPLVRVT